MRNYGTQRFAILMAAACLSACGGGAISAGGSTGGAALPLSQMQSAGRGYALGAPAGSVTITEFTKGLPKGGYSPGAMVHGPDGAMWFGEGIDPDFGGTYVDRIAPNGTITQYPFTDPSITFPSINDIVTGPDGNLWITDSGDNLIVRVSTTGKITTFAIPGGNPSPNGLAVGSDDALWFTELQNNAIGRVTTQGVFYAYTKGISQNADLVDIAAGPDGALWFTEYVGNRIGRIDVHGRVTEFSTGLDPHSGPNQIAAGPDNALWFTQRDEIGRITTAGKVTEYKGISTGEHPYGIALGPDGMMWFTERGAAAMIAKIGPNGAITEYSQGITPRSDPIDIAWGIGRTMWFTQSRNSIGRATF